jgi:O-acetyl-ADP-ribose deacetylase (regulator of RNase III)
VKAEVLARIADITTLHVDAIVNAANESLIPGGGVDGAIHRAAGPELAKAVIRLAPCPTGEARITRGFELPATHVIFTVGPVWRGGTNAEPELLASAYRSSLKLAKQHELQSIAFPAISTGVYGYPLRDATKIAVTTVRDELQDPGSLERIIFACFSDKALAAYRDEGVATQSN